MKPRVLFLTGLESDYISSVVWDGLQEVLGEENVVDSRFTPVLHSYTNSANAFWSVGGFRSGPCFNWSDEPYDLIVYNASYRRDGHDDFATTLREKYLKKDGKVVVVDGMDGYLDIGLPPFIFDCYLRREIRSGVQYQFPMESMEFACPQRWLEWKERERPYDIFVAHSLQPSHLRWEALSRVFQTSTRHQSIVCSSHLVAGGAYFDYLRRSKIAICCPGAESSDCMRFAEVVASGCVPVFLGLPAKQREYWFMPENSFTCSNVDDLAAVLDDALAADLPAMRRSLMDRVRRLHTTRERAERLLRLAGVTGWE